MIELIYGEPDIIECTADQDVSDWRIRAEICTNRNIVIVKTSCDDQIIVDKDDPTRFVINITAEDTELITKTMDFEIELESPNHDTLTRLQEKVNVIVERI